MFSVLLLLAEAFFCLIAVFALLKYFKNYVGKIALPLLILYFVVCLFFTNRIVQKVPVVYDEVTVTATGEKSNKANGNEVSVSGVTVNAVQQKFPEVKSGKWFFTTENNYMWRDSSDERQPQGTTNSITLKIPVGTKRVLKFNKSDWGGKATVRIFGKTKRINTYKAAELELPNSGRKIMLLQLAVRVLMFGIIIALFAALLLFGLYIYKSRNKALKKHGFYALLSLGYLLVNVPYLNGQHFWLDEMFQIGFSGTGKSLYDTLMVTETTPPLFRLLANIWYNLMPYGEQWLLLLTAFFAAGMVYVIGMLGEELGGKGIGYCAAMLSFVSTALLNSGVREFRSNSLHGLLAALAILYYLRNLKTGKYKIHFTVFMVLLAYTHYFGVFLCGTFFLLDVYFYFKKRRKINDITPYVILGIAYIPWLFRFMTLNQLESSAFWQDRPSLRELYFLFMFLCGSNVKLLLFIVGFVLLCVKLEKKKLSEDYFALLFISFVMIACVYAFCLALWLYRHLDLFRSANF